MKRTLLFAVTVLAFSSQSVLAQTFNNNTDGDFGKPHIRWTNDFGPGTTVSNSSVALVAVGGITGSIVDVSLAIQGLTVVNSDKMAVTLTHDATGTPVTLVAVDSQAADPAYTTVNVTFRNDSAAFGQAGIATSGFSYVGVDPTGNPDFDVFDGLDPNSNWTLAITSSDSTGNAAWTNIALGGFSATAVPEPASISLFGLGMLCLGTYRRRRRPDDDE